ncbi:MAG: carbohydrate ABC transporter permease, partial [Anaerolineae bacterium]|nr:carbohydrate ABC transporter permease [Anaerolineae bacterium]
MPRRTRARLAAVAFHLAGLLVTGACLLPLYWMGVASLRAPGLPPARTIEWWPQAAHWDNYAELFRIVPMGRYLLNSLVVVIIAVPVTLLVAALAGFALSQLDTARRRRLVTASVALLLIPGMAVWNLRFYILNMLGLIDSLAALIAPAVAGGSPLFVLLYYWACWRIPPELYESARLEGAGAWTVWWHVARPLVWPTTAAVAVLAFALYWGDFTTPVLYIFRP